MTGARSRPRNFSPGPAILPQQVFERVGGAVRTLQDGGVGDARPEARLSILEISHRSGVFGDIHGAAIELCHEVLEIPRTHQVLFLQGGASLQFCMVPMNLAIPGKPACYVDTGAWSKKAIRESKVVTQTEVLASSGETGYDRIPPFPEPASYRDASYVHITSNNTIFGTEYPELPELSGDVPLVVDCSSNIGSRPLAFERVGLGYAGAQKNLGPSGVTVVFLRKDLLQHSPEHIPHFLRYKTHVDADSLYNTPNTFGILVFKCVLEWMKEHGGLSAIAERNASKAGKLYGVLDGSELYRPHAQPQSRSNMNITWTLAEPNEQKREELTRRFLQQAEQAELIGLKGHRSVGGCRASIYNAFPEQGVEELCEFMREFERWA